MKYEFNAVKVRDEIIDWLKSLKETTGLQKVVLGISGGKDSTIVAALCCRAFGKENVFGLLMPNGTQTDISDSYEVCKVLGIDAKVKNIRKAYDAELELLQEDGDVISEEARINIAPRIRMMTLYAWGQTNHCRVCGTGNLSECTLGYFTKYGDGGVDFNPIRNLTTVEIIAIGDTMEELPRHLVHKTPSDGLCGLSDEERLGLTYLDVHNYLRNTGYVDPAIVEKIKRMQKLGEHKLIPIPVFYPEL